MRRTQYQTMRKDMEKAGLNPLLGLGTGGAGVPSGGQANMSGVSQGVSAGVASVLAARKLKAEIGLLEANADKAGKEAQVAETMAGLNSSKHASNAMQNSVYREQIQTVLARTKRELDDINWWNMNPTERERWLRSDGRGVIGRLLNDLMGSFKDTEPHARRSGQEHPFLEPLINKILGLEVNPEDYRPSKERDADARRRRPTHTPVGEGRRSELNR